jgi:transposase
MIAGKQSAIKSIPLMRCISVQDFEGKRPGFKDVPSGWTNGQQTQTILPWDQQLHRSRGWAYKWLKRYNNDGMLGLKDKPRSGRPADVPIEKLLEVRKELSENPSGWKVKQIMNIIYERTGVRYHEVHVYRLLHKWGFKPKVPQRRFINSASKE